MWSPDERVNCIPFNPSFQVEVSIGVLVESTRLGDAVFEFGPLDTVVISSKV